MYTKPNDKSTPCDGSHVRIHQNGFSLWGKFKILANISLYKGSTKSTFGRLHETSPYTCFTFGILHNGKRQGKHGLISGILTLVKMHIRSEKLSKWCTASARLEPMK